MDYDSTEIPAGYDRARDHGPEVQQLWMNIVASCTGTQRLNTILDLGCGTGRFSESLAAHFDAEVVGIDPSKKMLAQAQAKMRDRRVRYQLAGGEAIPLAEGDFQAGIDAIRADAAQVRDVSISEPIDIFVFVRR